METSKIKNSLDPRRPNRVGTQHVDLTRRTPWAMRSTSVSQTQKAFWAWLDQCPVQSCIQ